MKTKIIDGKEHRRCLDCKQWTPVRRKNNGHIIGRCPECHKIIRRRYNSYSDLEKNKLTGRYEISQDEIDRQLNDYENYPWVWSGLSSSQKKALKTGDVELLLKSDTRLVG